MDNGENNIAIQIKNLTKTYKNGVNALSGVDLEISAGEFFALLGVNGAGKSTIIGILTDLVVKSSGTVNVFGTSIDDNFSYVKSLIGVVPQEFNFDQFATCLDVVVNQAGYYGIPIKEAVLKAKSVLSRLGLGDKINLKSRSLSGGMKRRLMIAKALVHNPKILILDEPTAGVDVDLRIGMWNYLKEINQNGTTILLTTHYLEEVEQLCTRAAILKGGKIVLQNTVKNLLSSLEKETYIIEVKIELKDKNVFEKMDRKYEIQIIDPFTISCSLAKGDSLNSLINQLTECGIVISGIGPRGNRLEELFINTIKN